MKLKMCRILFAAFCLVNAVQGTNSYDEWDSLGDRIQNQVAAQLKPLEGLGDRISARVAHSLKPLQVRSSFAETAQPDVDDVTRSLHIPEVDLSGLDNLGEEISQSVHKGLEPVRAIELNFKIADGVGGRTIVTHRPSGKRFLIENYKIFTCSGSIDLNTGRCSGTVDPFPITENSPSSDWCFVRSYSQVNDRVCLSTGSVSVSYINGQMTCKGGDNQPVQVMTVNEYRNLCSTISESAEYRYIPDENDSRHVPIPNQNRYVRCENTQRNLCIFTQRNTLLDVNTGSSFYAGNIHANNGISLGVN